MHDDKEPSGRAKGGGACADKLTASERSLIASEAARRRWANQSEPTADMPRVLEGSRTFSIWMGRSCHVQSSRGPMVYKGF